MYSKGIWGIASQTWHIWGLNTPRLFTHNCGIAKTKTTASEVGRTYAVKMSV